MKKITAFTLLLANLLLLAACGGSEVSNDTTASAGGDTTAAPVETEVTDDIPELDFGGAPFRVLTADFSGYPTRTFSAEQTGDILDDALFARNQYLEERFNIEIEEITVSNFIKDISPAIRTVVLAGDPAYELAMMVDRFALNIGMEGCLYSYNDLPYIDLDKPYWNQQVKEDFSVDGKLFFCYGDDNLVFFQNTTILTFNKQLAEQYKLDDPYQLVYDGKWTYDRFMEMNAAVTNDLNGDSVMDINDQWGTIMATNMFYANFWLQDGLKLVEKDEDDLPYFNVPGNDALQSILVRLAEDSKKGCFYDMDTRTDYNEFLNTSAPANYDGSRLDNLMKLFTMNKSLFASATFIHVINARTMEADFGILPFPATEEKEPGYIYGSRTFGGFPYVVPASTENLEMVSAVMEASAYYAHQNVIPVLYDKVLKVKNTRDEDSVNMMDMIRRNRITDLGETYWWDNVENTYEQAFKDGDVNMASRTAAVEELVNADLEKAIEFFKALD